MESNNTSDDDTGGLIKKTFGQLKQKITSSTNNLSGFTNKMNEVQNALNSWKQFALLTLAGVFLIFLSFSFLPVIILVPQKFAALFSLGCLCILVGLALLKGPLAFYRSLTMKEKLPYSVSYISTLLLTLFFSLIKQNYILVILFSLLQMTALSFLVATIFPGGTQGMKYIYNKFFQCLVSICGQWIRPRQQAFLPI
ncbi:hypothetical protein PPERSA_07493 [Pseudocohnilembus persalinus]|uniref:Vesicle transport protein n=1 Tax=Pseudocohnilembus persalinus TaxID=266149 RepID=A0A0V0R2E0_PSEPJ|nr:hypothetical protein PPERSA_07493 [Pseudocohnilembus persalinus]|eukprot:KRX08681.1 hypothetical protein PPERSA_07493 [Pseudocohnilembus persalinus]